MVDAALDAAAVAEPVDDAGEVDFVEAVGATADWLDAPPHAVAIAPAPKTPSSPSACRLPMMSLSSCIRIPCRGLL
jgi:hypothetical protein